MDIAGAQWLKALEGENCHLRPPVAELGPDGEALKGVMRKIDGLAGLRGALYSSRPDTC